MRTLVKTVGDLTDEEYRWCAKANLSGQYRDYYRGSMLPLLDRYIEHPVDGVTDNARVAMLIDERFTTARALVGWALTFEDSVYFYIKPHHRNKGYGTALMKVVKNLIPTPVVYPWNNESGGFFSKFNIEDGYNGAYKFYLTDKPKVC